MILFYKCPPCTLWWLNTERINYRATWGLCPSEGHTSFQCLRLFPSVKEPSSAHLPQWAYLDPLSSAPSGEIAMNCRDASAEPHAASHWGDGFLSECVGFLWGCC